MLDLHTHIMGHMDRPTETEHIRAFLSRARSVGLREIGFSDHDYYESAFDFDLIRQTAEEYPDLNVRVAVEFDYAPGKERYIADMIKRYDLDYAIGSVHEIDGWAFDMSGSRHARRLSPDDMYRGYFDLVRQAAQSRLFQIIGHLDLIKINGIRPDSDVITLAEGALRAIADGDLCVEINTNGLNRPVRELYPETRLTAELAARGVAFTLGSDAHEAGRTGENLDLAVSVLRGCGVRQVCGFARKQRVAYTL